MDEARGFGNPRLGKGEPDSPDRTSRTAQRVIDMIETKAGCSVEFDFGNGDTLRVTSVTLADLADDIMVD